MVAISSPPYVSTSMSVRNRHGLKADRWRNPLPRASPYLLRRYHYCLLRDVDRISGASPAWTQTSFHEFPCILAMGSE